ncbi:hypothetical protein E1162_18340 [Rhodobacteraceae bacterium RKSG542]|uniref:hypothetical protein n=1 Tax=Pseudovibrio flavus TaxID=2529854 RepID=UPI0012BBC435|nr:hypothetical protein [Pseudovibrio flavus]MTI19204.1 hypothetical protein [Pseudovibrio flavus]
MERDIFYIREELDEVIVAHLESWVLAIKGNRRSRAVPSHIPGVLWYLNKARGCLCQGEEIMSERRFIEEALGSEVSMEEFGGGLDRETVEAEISESVDMEVTEKVSITERSNECKGRHKNRRRSCGR